MKYYKPELWAMMSNPKTHEHANQSWRENEAEYFKIFNSIKSRLPKKVVKILDNNAFFHDFNIREIKINNKKWGEKKPVSITIRIATRSNDNVEFCINYKYVKKLKIDFNSFSDIRGGFEDWGYCEFLPVDDKVLSHEIIFSSGASILIHFLNKGIEIL